MQPLQRECLQFYLKRAIDSTSCSLEWEYFKDELEIGRFSSIIGWLSCHTNVNVKTLFSTQSSSLLHVFVYHVKMWGRKKLSSVSSCRDTFCFVWVINAPPLHTTFVMSWSMMMKSKHDGKHNFLFERLGAVCWTFMASCFCLSAWTFLIRDVENKLRNFQLWKIQVVLSLDC